MHLLKKISVLNLIILEHINFYIVSNTEFYLPF